MTGRGAQVRLIGADQAPLLARPYYAGGDPGPIVKALAHVPELLEVTQPFVGAALGPSAISWRAKELVILRTSALMECRFCVQTHTAVAMEAGLSREEILALRGGLAIEDVFDQPSECVLLGWVDAVARGPGPVEAAKTSAMRAYWADHEMVELTLLVGVTLMLNRFATTLKLPTGDATLARIAEEGLL